MSQITDVGGAGRVSMVHVVEVAASVALRRGCLGGVLAQLRVQHAPHGGQVALQPQHGVADQDEGHQAETQGDMFIILRGGKVENINKGMCIRASNECPRILDNQGL